MGDSMMNPAQPLTVLDAEVGILARERPAERGCGADGLAAPPSDWESIWASCWRRIRRWRLPPHWTVAEWVEEMKAEGAVASLQAEFDFDPSHNVPLPTYIRMRVLGVAIARYRKEWSYANRTGNALPESHASPRAGGQQLEINIDVRLCVSGLSEPDRRIIERLFWEGET